jgi:hypothetical protein
MGRYTTPEDVQSQLGRTLTDLQLTYLSDRVIPAAEEWVDTTGGRVYGSGVVTAEQLVMGSPYTWLTTGTSRQCATCAWLPVGPDC